MSLRQAHRFATLHSAGLLGLLVLSPLLSYAAPGDLDNTFDPGSQVDKAVWSITAQAGGKLIIGGAFSTVRGATRNGIARLNGDGTVDTTFDPGTGANDFVASTAAQPDGKVLMAGYFTSVDGTNRSCIARLNADGSLDTTFNPGTARQYLGGSPYIRSISLQTDGKVLVGGNFSSISGTNRNGIARLNADGSLDTTFDPGTGAQDFGFPALVNTVAVQTDGKVLIGGEFSYINGTKRNGIARLNVDGSLDGTFSPPTGVNVASYCLAVQTDGKVLLAGLNGPVLRLNSDGSVDNTFVIGTYADEPVGSVIVQPDGKILVVGEFHTVSTACIVRLNANGTLDSTFNPGTGAENYRLYDTYDADLLCVAVQADGKILVGGSFNTFNGTNCNHVARLNANGTLDNSFSPNSGVNDMVQCVATQPDGKVLVGGYFTAVGTTPQGAFPSLPQGSHQAIARLNTNGSLDTTFHAGADSVVACIAVQPDGKLLVGGTFISIDNIGYRDSITRLNADGSLDPTFNSSSVPPAFSLVYSIVPQPDGKVLLGGEFTAVNGSNQNHIARLQPDGTPEASFNPGTGANSNVVAVALQLDGKVLVAGEFTTINGTTRNRIARLNADGSLDNTFDPGAGANDSAGSIALQPDGKVLLGGYFTSVNGANRSGIARLNADGSLDNTFNPGTGADNSVWSVAVQSNGKVLVGGAFTSINGTNRNYIARLNPDGSLDSTFNPGTEATDVVPAIAVEPDGRVLVGGHFTAINGAARSFVARLLAEPPMVQPASLAFPPVRVGTSKDITFTVTNAGVGPLTGTASVVLGASVFSVVSGSAYNLLPGQTQPVTVRYSPIAEGRDNGTVGFTGPEGTTRLVTGVAGYPPSITSQPSNQISALGDLATFTVASAGTAPLSYQWQCGGTNLLNQTNALLQFPVAAVNNGANYQAVVTNQYGSVTSSVAVLSVIPGTAGALWGMGYNAYGQLGDGTANQILSPELLTNDAVAAAAGQYFTLFVKADGTLWATGDNVYGQLGDGTRSQRASPERITSGVVAVAGAYYHSLFTKNDGTLWSMGYNSDGELGDGTQTTYRTSPELIASAVTAAAAGASHSLFVKQDGTLWGMGSGLSGQLGLGFGRHTNSPTLITNGVIAVAAGFAHTLFVKNDSTLWGTGYNPNGQLGDGTTATRYYPVLITNGVTAVAAGDWHSLFITTDRSLWGMGANGYGQLGDGTTAMRLYPVLITNGVAAAAAGKDFSLFVKADGTMWAMGGNSHGQLGDGTTNQRTSPVLIASGVLGVATGLGNSHSLFRSGRPLILTLPANQIVANGGNAAFIVTATGPEPLSYQWQCGGTNLAAQTSATLTLIGVTTNDAGNYRVIVTNLCGSVTSSVVTLNVGFGPATSAQPLSQNAISGTNVTFSVTAGGTAPLSYQWQRSGTNLLGQTDATLTLTAVTTNNAGSYRVIITNLYGSVTSSVAILNVGFVPSISVQPLSQKVISGSNVTFSVTAGGTPPLNYQWQSSGTNLPAQTNPTLTLTAVTTNNAGDYQVIVTNLYSSVTSSVAALYVVFPPSISVQPVSQNVVSGSNVAFTVAASGTPPLNYQWQMNGTNIMGQTNTTLTLTAVTTNNAGTYRVAITNLFGAVTSTTAALNVGFAPTITAQPSSQSVVTGSNATLSVTAGGTAPLHYQWQFGETTLVDQTNATLALAPVTTNNAGNYQVVITNLYGSVTSAVAAIAVAARPSITAVALNVDKTVTMKLSGTPACNYIIWAATNLAAPVLWQPVSTNTAAADGSWQFTDTNVVNHPVRFYRASTQAGP